MSRHCTTISIKSKSMIYCLAAVMTVVILSGCSFLWNFTNAGSFKKDVTALAKKQGVDISISHCQMVGTTRTAICELILPHEQVAMLVDKLGLVEVDTRRPDCMSIIIERAVGDGNSVDDDFRSWDSEGGCRNACSSYKQITIYKSQRRAPQLKIGDSAFEYLLIYYDPGSGKCCIQVSYAYG